MARANARRRASLDDPGRQRTRRRCVAERVMRRLAIREAEVARAGFVVADLLKLSRLPSGLEAVLQLRCLDA